MKKKLPNLEVNPLDNLFSTEEERQEDKLEKIINLNIGDIHEFSNHPFGVWYYVKKKYQLNRNFSI